MTESNRNTIIGQVASLLLLCALCVPTLSAASKAPTVEDARAVARLYSAAFDREPGVEGLNFWVDSLEQGKSLQQIAGKFRESPEFTRKYGALSNLEFVRQLYRNVLRREGNQSGIDFWLAKLEDGTSPALVLMRFSESPENRRKTDDLFAEMHRGGDDNWTYQPFSGPVNSTGTIDGFGSIFVNGVEYETDDALITLDGKPATEDDLRLGMVVTVKGIVNDDGRTGIADTVQFDDAVQGPVSEVVPGPDGDSLLVTILGVHIIVERTGTVFDDTSFVAITVGDVLEVSGFFESDGRLRATNIERKTGDDAGKVELRGAVTALAGTGFTLGSYQVEFSGADLSGVPGGVLAEGMFVEVSGVLANGVITASRVQEEDGPGREFEDEDEVRVEGAIAGFVSSAQFEVNGVMVDGSGAVLFPSGLVLADGVVVQIEGNWVADTLVARKIEARRGRVEIEADVVAIDPGNGTVTLGLAGGTVTVVVDARTLIDDDTEEDDALTLDGIAVADFLAVEAIQNGGRLVATRIDRDESDDEMIQAPVTAFVAGESITLLGITFTVNNTSFESRAGKPLSAEQFFAELQAGDLVKIKDDKPADGIADEVDFERERALDGDECESDDDCDAADDEDCESDDDCNAADDDESDDSVDDNDEADDEVDDSVDEDESDDEEDD